ncbi:MAG: hypothetical protein ACKVKM_12780 [Verrucomicrobiia bacterium]
MNGINTGIGETTISRGFIACLAIVLLAQHAVAQRVSVRPGRTGIIPALTTEGHPFRYRLPVRPLNYLVTPDPNDPSQRAFTNASPLAATWVRAGTDLNRTHGDYFVDPFVWLNNSQRPANAVWNPALGRWVDPTGQWVWRDPSNTTNWISTRTIRVIIRQPFTPPR